MALFNQFGLDTHLIIAQMVNFGLLLWLLNKFLYKPILNHIEKDEKILSQALTQKKLLEQEKEKFKKQKRKEIINSKKKSKKIIKEAEFIARAIKKEAQKETEESKKLQMEQTKQYIKLQKNELKKNIEKNTRTQVIDQLKKSIRKATSKQVLKTWQNFYFNNLIEEIENMAFDKSIMDQANTIILEYAYSIDPKQENLLIKTLAKKAVMTPRKITKKKNINIISGFRLEFAGMVIESNVLNEIKNATK